MKLKLLFLSLVTAITSLFQTKLPPSPLATSVDLSSLLTEKISKQVNSNLQLDYQSAKTPPVLNSIPRYLVYNAKTGQVYAAKGEKETFSPASFTKLMTAQIAIDIKLPDHLLTVSALAINKEPTVLGLKVGEQLPLNDLLRASIATSANDAAAVLAEASISPYGGNLETFIELMNQKAKLLNMGNTRFINPEGYDNENQYSTIEEIAKLVHNAQTNYPEIISAGQSDRDDIKPNPTHGGYYLSNWNGLLGVYPGVNGLKIAYTEKAGYSAIVTCVRNQIEVVAIVSGADSIPERDLAAASLLDAAYIEEKISPVNLTKSRLQPRYNQWDKLIKQVRAELKALEKKNEIN